MLSRRPEDRYPTASDLLADLDDRIKANCRVLRNQRNAGPTKSSEFVFPQGEQIVAFKPYRSPAMGASRKESQQGSRQGTLSRTGFSHNADHFARLYVQANAIECTDWWAAFGGIGDG